MGLWLLVSLARLGSGAGEEGTLLPLPLRCHYCHHYNEILRTGEDVDFGCVDPEGPDSPDRSDFTRICSPREPTCQVRTVFRQGLFARLIRNCGGSCGISECVIRGIGLSELVCTRCCNSTFCNTQPVPDLLHVPVAPSPGHSLFPPPLLLLAPYSLTRFSYSP